MSSLLRPPYPGELLWSALARTRHHFPGLTPEAISRQGGLSTKEVGRFFPSQLQRFADALPPARTCTALQLLQSHTLFPFAAPFLPLRESRELQRSMLAPHFTNQHLIRHAHEIVGISRHYRLRYCPACAGNDTEVHGVPAWRSIHQLPALAICPDHLCGLIAARVGGRGAGEVAGQGEVREEREPAFAGSRLQIAMADAAKALRDRLQLELGREQISEAMRETIAEGAQPTEASELLGRMEAAFGNDGDLLGSSAERAKWVTGFLGGDNLPLRLEHYAALCALIGLPFGRLLEAASRVPETWPHRPFMARARERRGAALVPRFRA